MKKFFAILLTMVIFVSTMGVPFVAAKSESDFQYSTVQISHKGELRKNNKRKAYSKIVRSYKQLEQLKKYVKKNFVKKKKYINALNKYKKSFFKKKALVFTAYVFDAANAKSKLADVEKKNNTIRLHVDRIYAEHMIKMFISHTNTYLITVKKKDIKGVKKVKVKYTGVPYFSPTQGTDATSTATPGTVAVPTVPTTPKCQLIVNGVNLTNAGHYSRYDIEKGWAEIPLIPVLEAIGAKVVWQDDNLAEVILNGEEYVFNVAEKSLTNVKTKFNVLFRSPGAYYPYYEVINGEAVLDSNAIEWFLSENGYGIEINKETLTVIIEPLPADKMPMTDIKLMVNGVDLSEQGYYAVYYPVTYYADVPFVPVLEALGAKIVQEDARFVIMEFYGEEYTFDKENFLFGKTGSELEPLYPPPGDFTHRQIINGVNYVNLSSVKYLYWFDARYQVAFDVKVNIDEKMIIINLPEEGFPSN